MQFYSPLQVFKVSALCIVSTVVVIGVVASFTVPSTVEYVNVTPEPVNEIVELTQNILESEEFQEEMRATATARALYILSNKSSTKSIELAEMAKMSAQRSDELASDWFSSQTVVTTF